MGSYMSWATFAYGATSLLATVGRLSAIHSDIRLPVSVENGFFWSYLASGLIVAHAAHAIWLRNRAAGSNA